jgi:hypothetical protein
MEVRLGNKRSGEVKGGIVKAGIMHCYNNGETPGCAVMDRIFSSKDENPGKLG